MRSKEVIDTSTETAIVVPIVAEKFEQTSIPYSQNENQTFFFYKSVFYRLFIGEIAGVFKYFLLDMNVPRHPDFEEAVLPAEYQIMIDPETDRPIVIKSTKFFSPIFSVDDPNEYMVDWIKDEDDDKNDDENADENTQNLESEENHDLLAGAAD